MTYSLTEKEEVLLEQKLEELFTLTELDPNEYIKDPALKKVRYKGREVTKQQADWLRQGDAEDDHWSDMYTGLSPKQPAVTGGGMKTTKDTPEPHDPTKLITNPNYKQPPVPSALTTGAAALALGLKGKWSPAGKSPSKKLKTTGAPKTKKPSKIKTALSKINPLKSRWSPDGKSPTRKTNLVTPVKTDPVKPVKTDPVKPVKIVQVSPEDIEKERKILAKTEEEKLKKAEEEKAKKEKAEKDQKARKNAQKDTRLKRFKELERIKKIEKEAKQGQKEKISKFRKAEIASRTALNDYNKALKNRALSPEQIKKIENTWKTKEAERVKAQDAMKKGRATITGIKEHLIQSEKVDKKIKTLDDHIREQERKHGGKKGATEKQITDLNSKKQELKKTKEARNTIENAARKGVKQVTYTIKAGDDLTKIARRHGVSVNDLVKANNIKNKNLIISGAKLNIPIKGDISPANVKPIPPKTKFSTAKNLGPSTSNPERHLVRGKNGQYYLQNPANKMDNKPLTNAQAKIELSKMGAQAEAGAKAQARQTAKTGKTKLARPSVRMGLKGGAALVGFHMLLSGMNKLAWEKFVKKYEEDRNKLPENSPLRKLSPNQFYKGQQFFPGKNPFKEADWGTGTQAEKNFYEYGIGLKSGSYSLSPSQVKTRRKMFNDKFSAMTERDLNTELFLPLEAANSSGRDEQFEIIVQKPDGSYINITDQEKRAKKRGKVLDPNTLINEGDVVLYSQSISDKVAKETWANMAKQGTKGTASWLDIKYNMRTTRMKVFYMTRGNKDHLDTKYHAGGTHEHSLNPNWDPSDYVGKRADELGNERKLGVGLFSKKGFQGNINMERTWREHNELMKEFRAAELEAVRKGQPFDPSSILKKFGMTEDELFALLPAESALGLTGDESPVTDYVNDTISDFGKWSGLYDYQSTSDRQIDRVVNSGLEGDEPSAIAGQGIASSGWPADTQTYNTLITKLGIEYKIDPKLLKALSQKESGTGVFNGKLKQGKFKGDTPRGTRGAWGLFHVRKGEIRQDDQGKPFLYDPAVVDEYNLRHSTLFQWADVAGDALLAAHIGADTFAVYYKEALETNSDPMKAAEEAYAKYNGGPEWRNKSDAKTNAKIFVKILKSLSENKTYTKKSAILEGIAKAA